MAFVTLSDAGKLPLWRHPITLLALLAVGMNIAYASWSTLLNNFVHNVALFDGRDLGWLQSVREIPGFLSFLVIFLIIVMREQTLAWISILLLGAVVMITAQFPTFTGLLLTTFVSSLGFHYYETVRQSLELQWIDKARAPVVLGWLIAAGSAASLLAYVFIIIAWDYLHWDYNALYIVSGGATVLVALYCWLAFPRIKSDTKQRTQIVIKREYWLYYTLQFMAGARRQIFVVFAAFMMVERYGFDVHEVTALFLINFLANIIFAPIVGKLVQRFGERNALLIEYFGLTCIFATYVGIYIFQWGAVLAATLYVLDHMFFAMALAQKTYFQKIAAPEDITPTAAVAFTINHIGAVFLPALLGYLWLYQPAAVFGVATAFAVISFALSVLIPRHPQRGYETILKPRPTQ